MDRKTLLAVFVTVALALGGWNLKTTASTETKVAVQTERVDNLKEQLKALDEKLDKVLDKLDKR